MIIYYYDFYKKKSANSILTITFIPGVAKWTHIESFFNMEKANPNFVFAPALTQQHLQPNGKQKMKVRLAAQVLSHSVAAGLYAKVAQSKFYDITSSAPWH